MNCLLDNCSEISQRSYAHTFSSGLAFIFISVYIKKELVTMNGLSLGFGLMDSISCVQRSEANEQ